MHIAAMNEQRQRMHKDEVPIDGVLVSELLAVQFPAWAQLPLQPVASTGTVNAIYRLGDEMVVRLPLQASGDRHLRRELLWLPKLADKLPLDIPEPLAAGNPSNRYPFSWAVFRWIDAEPYADDRIADEAATAEILGDFVLRLRQALPRDDAPRTGRRPLAELDQVTRAALAASAGVIDSDAARRAWEQALTAPVWDGVPVWIHTDLLRPNLLVRTGQVRAVIDFGNVGTGDLAADVIAAWSVFGSTGRHRYRSVLNVDDGTWNRARGYALHQAALVIPYYAKSNPGFVATAKRTVEQVLQDVGAS